MPRELPILMNGDMVRAVLDGTKTQTRRPLIHPYEVHANGYITKPRGNERLCPYEAPYHKGDTLWVRETWAEVIDVLNLGFPPARQYLVPDEMKSSADYIIWRADGEFEWCDADGFHTDRSYWKPSIHMPRHAARIFLPVTRVRVERVQDISGADAKAEGVKWETYPDLPVERHVHRACLQSFARLWDGLYAKRGLGWDANPFVWVIEWDAYRKPAPVVTDLALGEVE